MGISHVGIQKAVRDFEKSGNPSTLDAEIEGEIRLICVETITFQDKRIKTAK